MPRNTLTDSDVYEVMHRVGYTEVVALPSGLRVYATIVHGAAAEFFAVSLPAGGTVPAHSLVDALDGAGVPRAIVHDAIDQLA